tara:strand:- start:771 stop:1070 length:300 start_codon:yes stop_codon:yes gene_type:complete
MKIGKYEFDSLEQANLKISSLGEGHRHTVVKLGNIKLEEGEYDVNGDTIKEPVYSVKYSVDVLFIGVDSHPYGWKSYSVQIDGEGVHGFLGVKYQENKF